MSRPALPEKLEACGTTLPRTGIAREQLVEGTEIPKVPDAFWVCGACLGVPRMPASLECGHISCEVCLRQIVISHASYELPVGFGSCPRCRFVFSLDKMTPFRALPGVTKIQWQAMKFRCAPDMDPIEMRNHKIQQCGFVGQFVDFLEHERTGCPNRIVYCPSAGCGVKAIMAEMVEHYATCDKAKVFCSTCGMAVLFRQLEHHNCLETLQRTLLRMLTRIMIVKLF